MIWAHLVDVLVPELPLEIPEPMSATRNWTENNNEIAKFLVSNTKGLFEQVMGLGERHCQTTEDFVRDQLQQNLHGVASYIETHHPNA